MLLRAKGKTWYDACAGPEKDDICYATQNRQGAVKALAKECDLVLVVGSPNSSNSNRLREMALNLGADSHMIDNASQLKREWLQGKQKIGVTAGASAPEVLVQEVLAQLKEWGVDQVTELQGKAENVVFARPKALA